MDDHLKTLYEIELTHLQSRVSAFAEQEPYRDLAERLGLGDGARLRDPFVDWLLEGSAFLAARIQHQIESEFPRFSGALLDIIFPHLAAPTPSMLIAQLGFSKPNDAGLAGPVAAKGSTLELPVAFKDTTRRVKATFVTGRSVAVWPAQVSHVEFLPNPAAVEAVAGAGAQAASGLAMTLRLDTDNEFNMMQSDMLDLHFTGDAVAARLMEAIGFRNAQVAVVQGTRQQHSNQRLMPIDCTPLGFEAEVMSPKGEVERDTLLPYGSRSLDAYRLLHEFFALPSRFRFVRLKGMRNALRKIENREATIIFLFDHPHPLLAGRVQPSNIRLNCVPAINLFPKRADNVDPDLRKTEFEVLADRTLPTAYEVHSILRVSGRTENGQTTEFSPYFATSALGRRGGTGDRYFSTARRSRQASQTLDGDRSLHDARYRGSDLFLSLVDEEAKPFDPRLRSLHIDTLCTNRHLALRIRSGEADFIARDDIGGDTARLVGAPSRPGSGVIEGRRQWDVVSHLALNNLSLMETDRGDPASALREILSLYAFGQGRGLIDALTTVTARPVTGRQDVARTENGRPAPVTVARGLEICIGFEPDRDPSEANELAAILERFFASYVEHGNFTRTVVLKENGEHDLIFPNRSGLRAML